MPGLIELKVGDYQLEPGDAWHDRAILAIILAVVLTREYIPQGRQSGTREYKDDIEESQRLDIQTILLLNVYKRLEKATQCVDDEEALAVAGASKVFQRLERAHIVEDRIALLQVLGNYCRAHKERLTDTMPLVYYLNEGKLSRIFTIGVLILICEQRYRGGDAVLIGEAIQYICDTYKTGPLWISNTNQTPKLWTEMKPVAHFCAALVRLLLENGVLRADRNAFIVWRRNMGRFLELATHYEGIVAREPMTSRAVYDRHRGGLGRSRRKPLLDEKMIWRLPPFKPTSAIKAVEALPAAGRRD